MWWSKFANESFWLSGKDLAVILISYALGCFTTGYYLVRFRTGEDIRDQGSGNVGARNVGRVRGPFGFFITLLFDVAKGALAVKTAIYFGLGPGGTVLAMLAVVVGHIWPAQLRFQGGKGIGPSLGALLVYDWVLVVLMAVVFLVTLSWCRRFTISGLVAFAVAPLLLAAGDPGMTKVVGISVLAILVLIAHRKNIREELERHMLRGQVKEKQSHRH